MNYVDYEDKFNLKEKHDLLLKIIEEFDAVCSKHDIKYSLSCGTLLGAIRHEGFIPWDDDADIMMTRNEYRKLMRCEPFHNNLVIFKTTFLDRVSVKNNNPNGVYVDLFVLDNIPEKKLVYQVKEKTSILLRCYFVNKKQLQNAWNNNADIVKIVKSGETILAMGMGAILKMIFKNKNIWTFHDRIVSMPINRSSPIMKTMTDEIRLMKKDVYQSKWFEEYIRVPFCNKLFMIIKEYDSYLTYLYTDYMKLPPESNRVPDSHLALTEDSTAKKYSRIMREI